ncbi:MAG: DEAD/DEAH box helicase family protein [Microcystaceae cyanobacterium]
MSVAQTIVVLKPRPYQSQIVEALESSSCERQLVIAGTGAGKTVIATILMSNAQQRGEKSLFLVHRATLLQQTAQKLRSFDLPFGLIGSKYKLNLELPIQVASLQTLSHWSKEELQALIQDYDQVLFDECHITNWFVIAQHFCPPLPQKPPLKIIGLTATPWRRSKRESLADYYQNKHLAPLPQELIRDGFLSPFSYFSVGKIQRKTLKIEKNGEYETRGQKLQANNPDYIQEIVKEWFIKAPQRPTIAFALDIEHAHNIAHHFREAGIPAAAVDGTMSAQQREKSYSKLEQEEITVLASCEALSEGFDVPKVSCVILFRLTTSRAKYYQQIGRGARISAGKQDCVVLDAVGLINGQEFGFLEDLSLEDLAIFPGESGESKGEAPKKTCPECKGIMAAGLRICPHCQYQFPAVKYDPIMPPPMKLLIPESQKQQYEAYQKLLREAYQNNKSFNWCDGAFKQRFGHHPPVNWRKGAIFGDDPTEKDRQAYRQYLKAIASQFNLDKTWIKNNEWEFS